MILWQVITAFLGRFPKLANSLFFLRKKLGLAENVGRRYSTTRFAMYNSIEEWINKHHPSGDVLLVSERNEHSIRKMLGNRCRFTVTRFPKVDVMKLFSLGRRKFDVVVTDQVLEHVSNPFLAVEQIYLILKPGGIAINTSCSFNPIHDSVDYFRFTPQGFAQIHKKFRRILLLGSWGNKEVIGRFVRTGYNSFNVRLTPRERQLAVKNDPLWPWSVWCIAKK